MEVLTTVLVTFLLIIFFLGAGVWIFLGIFMVGLGSLYLIGDFPLDRIGFISKSIIWKSASSWEIAAIPLFIWMGEIIFRTDISDRLFRGLSPFVEKIPGRLLHTNILGCTLFACISGSTAATTATVGKITVTELKNRHYSNNLSIGSLAGAGSLGLMLPPSIVMIIYGVLAEVSIAKLFAAGVIPGLLVAFIYSVYIMVKCIIDPSLAPSSNEKFNFNKFISSIKDLLPILILIVLILGGIYTGIATPSEAAALGVAMTITLTLVMRTFSWKILVDAAIGSIRSSCMVCSILVSAAFLSSAIGYLHIPTQLATLIDSMQLSPFALLAILMVFYLILGLFLDGISIVVMTLPITLPLILQAGFDPIWYGVFLVLMVELAQMTPPVGFNLFVLQGLTGQPIGRVVKASLPFFVLMCFAVLIIIIYPRLSLWLPSLI